MDYNIEFAHIYADEAFGSEQEKSINALKEVISELNGKSFVTCVLIDEFSPEEIKLDFDGYINEVKSRVVVDFLAYESKLSEISDKLIKELPNLKTEMFDDKEVLLLIKDDMKIGLKSNDKPTCALLIAAWTLCRFGIYQVPDLKNLTGKEFKADNLITILPKKYRESENKVLEILKSSRYRELVDKIQYKFI